MTAVLCVYIQLLIKGICIQKRRLKFFTPLPVSETYFADGSCTQINVTDMGTFFLSRGFWFKEVFGWCEYEFYNIWLIKTQGLCDSISSLSLPAFVNVTIK